MTESSLKICVSGMIAGVPHHGGASWAVLQYVLGLRRLGHDVYFVEPVNPDPDLPGSAWKNSASVHYFRRIMAQFDLEERAALLHTPTQQTVGLSYQELCRQVRSTDVLLNLSGLWDDDALVGEIAVRAFLDLDPGFTQLWHAVEGIDLGFARHTHFLTVGLTLGSAACAIPTCGNPWIPTLQPVVLEYWPVAAPLDAIQYNGLTTVANWRSYGSIEWNGIFYGQKAHSWRGFMSLPGQTTERFMPALAIHPDEKDDLEALRAGGWHLLDPGQAAEDPVAYGEFIRGSKAEFGFAKSGYVAAKCGWFSDRSACYLASGRPVIAQATDFDGHLPTGAGLFSFAACDEALAAIDALNCDYRRHCKHARDLAEAYFASDRVLNRVLAALEGAA